LAVARGQLGEAVEIEQLGAGRGVNGDAPPPAGEHLSILTSWMPPELEVADETAERMAAEVPYSSS
jgi:hypothetical protein